ncbi:MAG: oligopeptide:H+ symporter [Methanobrevibacter sp.]|jgi:POT family proton-dependent oligopeptide transporter|nr:oligopeptide:H+ symporter [Candidatus Methanovirga procula]
MLSYFKFPKFFYSLGSLEFGWMFSYYGMKAILLLYMIYAVTQGGLGIEKSAAASIVAIYGSLTFMLGVIGSYVTDRILGPYYANLYGSIIVILGHVALGFLQGIAGLFIGLGLVLIGTGMSKGVKVIIGHAFEGKDNKRDAAFQIFYLIANIGSFISPLIVGWLGMSYNFHWGFTVAAIGMFIGFLIFVLTEKRHFNEKSFRPLDKIQSHELKDLIKNVALFLVFIFSVLLVMYLFNLLTVDNIILVTTIFISGILPISLFYSILSSKKITKKERSKVVIFIPLFLSSLIFWIMAEQIPIILTLFAQNNVNLLGMPLHWLQSFNPLFIIILMPFFVYLWEKLGDKNPSTPKKFFYGLLITGLAYIILSIPQLILGLSSNINVVWLIFTIFLIAIGEALISPLADSISYVLSPELYKARMMFLVGLTNASAQALNSQIVKFFNNDSHYFLILACLPILTAITLFYLLNKIENVMES